MAAPYGWATLVGFVSLVVVSLLTRREDPYKIEKFFDNQRRTTDLENLPKGESKPLAADYGQELVFPDLPGWLSAERRRGFWRRYREDIVGFTLAWLTVGALVLFAWLIIRIGA